MLFRDVVDLLQPVVEPGPRGNLETNPDPKVHEDYFCNRREIGGTEGNVEGVEASRATDEFEIMSPPDGFGTSWRVREAGIIYDILSIHDSTRNRYAVVARCYRSQRTGTAFLAMIPAEGDIALGVVSEDAGYLLGVEHGGISYYLGLQA